MLFGYDLVIPQEVWAWGIGIALVILLFKPLRALAQMLFSGLVVPGVAGTVGRAALFLWWILKQFVSLHVELVRHWTTEHRVLFPTLQGRAPRAPKAPKGKRAAGGRTESSAS